MPTLVLLWIWFCAYLNCAGWALSAVHQLNAGGYAVALLIWLVALFIWKQKTSQQIFPIACYRKFRRRFRRPFPLAFLILAAMAFLGGVIYAPTNYDALAYRLPRVLHWLAAGQWHWIHTIFPRVNTRGCAIEWVSAPIIALFNTDRLLFLINFVSFLFLPGLIFSVFTRLGVRRRVAWHWMWILPAGYCFLLQAASIGNDLFGATFALSAVDFALRARKSGAQRDVFSSVLAAALLTGVKMTNLPLPLPWALAILPSLKLFFRWPVRSFLVAALAVSISALPVAFFNSQHYGDWTGMKPESSGMKKNPALLTVQNTALCAVQNFSPPVFPFGNLWNHVVQKAMPAWWQERLAGMMEPNGANLHIDEIQVEEDAGLGFGVCVLLLASVVFAEFRQRRSPPLSKTKSPDATWLAIVRLSPFISLLVMFTQANSAPLARTIAPYYALLIPVLLLRPAHEQLVRLWWWRGLAFAGFFAAAGLLVISPARPLFPVGMFLEKISGATSPAMTRVREVYSVYHARNHAFAPALAVLPPDVKILGVVTFDDPEASLWQPFGARQVVHVCPQDTAADLKSVGVEYILVRNAAFGIWFSGTFDDWMKRMNAQVIQKIPLDLRAAQGPMDWYLVRLN